MPSSASTMGGIRTGSLASSWSVTLDVASKTGARTRATELAGNLYHLRVEVPPTSLNLFSGASITSSSEDESSNEKLSSASPPGDGGIATSLGSFFA
ncbi:hypothetical protein Nepgr_008233 [Nepenthes gracilis]|uniref:Uncharacterized protein n=1 Tax=Nepenthes gracilis TaxID=150966 RepID=A0AAD3S8C4_NEPGR|nr:hypothetical protein Nepgr_008233 [Nepenthes gracilis]